MVTLVQFGRNIRSRASRLENNSVRLTQRVAKRALRELVLGTPVDKGVTRSNWRVSLGTPTRRVIPAYFPGNLLGIRERANARAAISAGNAQINKLRVGAGRRGTGQAGQAIFIVNSVPWLGRLRRQSSHQQPRDWVAIAQLNAAREARGVRLLDRTLF